MEKVVSIVLFLMAAFFFTLSFMHIHERGPLLNNAAFFATPQERKKMDKRPYYRQSGIVFALLGILFLSIALETVLKTGWLYYAAGAVTLLTIVYTIASSIKQLLL